MVTLIDKAALSAAALKSLFAHIPTAVTIVTAGSGRERYGATVGTLGALSLDPPLLMFALKQASGLLRHLGAGSRIGVNVLRAEQHDIARRFATPNIDRFELTHWCDEFALPRIDDALIWAAARVRDRLQLGDHVLITALIEQAQTEAGTPLVYWQRQFKSLAKIEEGERPHEH